MLPPALLAYLAEGQGPSDKPMGAAARVMSVVSGLHLEKLAWRCARRASGRARSARAAIAASAGAADPDAAASNPVFVAQTAVAGHASVARVCDAASVRPPMPPQAAVPASPDWSHASSDQRWGAGQPHDAAPTPTAWHAQGPARDPLTTFAGDAALPVVCLHPCDPLFNACQGWSRASLRALQRRARSAVITLARGVAAAAFDTGESWTGVAPEATSAPRDATAPVLAWAEATAKEDRTARQVLRGMTLALGVSQESDQ